MDLPSKDVYLKTNLTTIRACEFRGMGDGADQLSMSSDFPSPSSTPHSHLDSVFEEPMGGTQVGDRESQFKRTISATESESSQPSLRTVKIRIIPST
jgi:hypothetical protein